MKNVGEIIVCLACVGYRFVLSAYIEPVPVKTGKLQNNTSGNAFVNIFQQ
jgi:hypothetical protein